MKRNVLCLFSFLLILLVFCSCISPKAEEEMQTLVEARHGLGTKYQSKRNIVVGSSAITWEHSDDILFNIIEGTGWESGLRIAEIPPTYYDRYIGHVELGSGTDYWYIFTASREPVSGGAVTVVEQTWQGDDTYLIWHPEAVENLDKLPNSMDVLSRTENAALVSMRKGTFPFFEHRVWYTLQKLMDGDVRVYSLHDVQLLLDALPWISGIGMILLCSLLLWGGSWILLHKMRCRKWLLWVNTALIGGLLSSLPWLLNQFDLPASLMPKACILDISHYSQTFDRILSALDSMDSPIVRDALEQAAAASVTVLGLGLLSAAVVIAIESVVSHRRGEEELAGLE